MPRSVEYIDPPGTAPAQGNYSHACRVKSGDLSCSAGQLSVDADGHLVGKDDFETRFKQVFAKQIQSARTSQRRLVALA